MDFEILPTPANLEQEKAALTARILGPGRLARMAERLREGNREVSALSFCALSQNTMIGSISYWPICIGGKTALLLGPLVVNPDWRGRGVGRGLISGTLPVAEDLGHTLVLLVGDLSYYGPSGFVAAPPGLVCPGPVDEKRLLVYETKPGLAAGLEGKIRPAG